MEIRNKKERETSIGQFLLVALIPLLLAFWGGFSLGRTNKVEQEDWRKKYQELDLKYKTMDKAIQDQHYYFNLADSILKVSDQEIDKMNTQLSGIYASGDDYMIQEQELKLFEMILSYREAIKEYELKLSGSGTLSFANDKAFEWAEKIMDKQDKVKSYRRDLFSCMRKKEMEASLEDREQELEQAYQEKDAQLDREKLENDLLLSQKEYNMVKAELNQCKESKTPILTSRDIIIQQVNTMEQQVLPKMQITFLGNNRTRIDELKEQIKGHLSAISNAARTIQ